MQCPKCKKEIDDKSLICQFCNKKIGSICKVCNTYNPINAEKCSNCNQILLKIWSECGAANFPEATSCRKCGIDFINETEKSEGAA